jgi:hypothetical protein
MPFDLTKLNWDIVRLLNCKIPPTEFGWRKL